VAIYPAKHFITEDEKLKQAILDIEQELAEQLAHTKFLRASLRMKG